MWGEFIPKKWFIQTCSATAVSEELPICIAKVINLVLPLKRTTCLGSPYCIILYKLELYFCCINCWLMLCWVSFLWLPHWAQPHLLGVQSWILTWHVPEAARTNLTSEVRAVEVHWSSTCFFSSLKELWCSFLFHLRLGSHLPWASKDRSLTS